MKTVLHVGLQKTGSSFLQKHVFPNADGICYVGRPYTQDNHAFNTLQYADSTLFDSELLRRELEKIREVGHGKPVVVISDELFSGFPFYNYLNRATIAERLGSIVPEAEVLVFVRNQLDLILSLYNQYVKLGWYAGALDRRFLSSPGPGATLEEWRAGDLPWRPQHRFIWNRAVCNVEHFRYSRLLELYERCFRKTHVFAYEDLAKKSPECFDRLSEVLQSEIRPPREEDASAWENVSLNERELHQRRLTNKLVRISGTFDSRSGRRLARGLALLTPRRAAADREHVRSSLQAARIHEDNQVANDRWSLGLDRYPGLYFDFGGPL